MREAMDRTLSIIASAVAVHLMGAQSLFQFMALYEGEKRATDQAADLITGTDTNPFEFFAALTVPGGGWDYLEFMPSDGGPTETWIAQGNGSWVCHTTNVDGTHTVRQGGPSKLWDKIEMAHTEWQELGKPTRDWFGLTVTNGEHTIWLDSPDSGQKWELSIGA